MKSIAFALFINVCIVVNAVVIGLETDYACKKSSPACKPSDTLVWMMAEYFFLHVFVVEAVLKILHLTWFGYWQDDWNKFDFGLVVFAVTDIWILAALSNSADGDLKIFSVLRVMRAFRLVRLVKLLRQFKELHLLAVGMYQAGKMLILVGAVLLVVLYVFAIMFTITIGQDPTEFNYIGKWKKNDYWGKTTSGSGRKMIIGESALGSGRKMIIGVGSVHWEVEEERLL